MRTSLVSFLDFTGTAGSPRMRIPATARAMYENPARHPWAYYSPMVNAIVTGYGDITELTTRTKLAIANAERREREMKTRGQAKHFRELASGAVKLRSSVPVTRVEKAPTATWTHGNLEIRVTKVMLVTRPAGLRELWFLYLKERPLEQGTADPALMILTDVAAHLNLDAAARVIDVRRAKTFTLRSNRTLALLRAHVSAEAEQFARLWELAA